VVINNENIIVKRRILSSPVSDMITSTGESRRRDTAVTIELVVHLAESLRHDRGRDDQRLDSRDQSRGSLRSNVVDVQCVRHAHNERNIEQGVLLLVPR